VIPTLSNTPAITSGQLPVPPASLEIDEEEATAEDRVLLLHLRRNVKAIPHVSDPPVRLRGRLAKLTCKEVADLPHCRWGSLRRYR
jgi:hypothetical protein